MPHLHSKEESQVHLITRSALEVLLQYMPLTLALYLCYLPLFSVMLARRHVIPGDFDSLFVHRGQVDLITFGEPS